MSSNITVNGQAGSLPSSFSQTGVGVVHFGSDDQMNVVFYKKSVHDPEESRRRGMPWAKAVDYVRIQQPGEKDYIDRPVAEGDQAIMRWPGHWARYQQGQSPAPNGTPVECLFPQHPEIAANLHGIGVHTVQQLAGLTDHGLQSIGMGAAQWKLRAKEFLTAANGGSGMHRLQKQNEELQGRLEVQDNQIAMLKSQLDKLMAQVSQKIQPGMIQSDGGSLAQIAYSPQSEQADFTVGDDLSEPLAAVPLSSPPLFTSEYEADEPPDEVLDASNAELTHEDNLHARKGGWPKGKSRKPQN